MITFVDARCFPQLHEGSGPSTAVPPIVSIRFQINAPIAANDNREPTPPIVRATAAPTERSPLRPRDGYQSVARGERECVPPIDPTTGSYRELAKSVCFRAPMSASFPDVRLPAAATRCTAEPKDRIRQTNHLRAI